jgi:hypothetical protein
MRSTARSWNGASFAGADGSRMLFDSEEDGERSYEVCRSGLKEAFDRLFLIRADLAPTEIEESLEMLQYIKDQADLRNKRGVKNKDENVFSGRSNHQLLKPKRKMIIPPLAQDQEHAFLKKSKL